MNSTKLNLTNINVNKVDNVISTLNTQVMMLKERLTEEREQHREIYAKQKQEIEVLKEKIVLLQQRSSNNFTLEDSESSVYCYGNNYI
tara:strand:- start:8387 stop:8650 length:264 start_codon:yes stop_codon:yes gene_type:complete